MKWLSEPFEIEHPGDLFRYYEEVVSKDDSCHDVNRIMASCNNKPAAYADQQDYGGKSELVTLNCLELKEDDCQEAEVVTEEEVVAVSVRLNHQ